MLQSRRLFAWLCLMSLLLTSCFSQPEKKYYQLRVTIDNGEDFHLDSIYINAPYQRDRISPEYPKMDYDTVTGFAYFRFDSVRAGEITIRCQSQLNSLFEKKILLQSDSSIIIHRNELPAFQKISFRELAPDSLAPGEQMIISVSMSGCFSQYREKIIIDRTADNWNLTFTSNRQNNYLEPRKNTSTHIILPHYFRDSLLQFSKSLLQFEANAPFGGCTTNYTYFIQKGNRYATLNDGTCSDFIRYHALLTMIQPEWFRNENDDQ